MPSKLVRTLALGAATLLPAVGVVAASTAYGSGPAAHHGATVRAPGSLTDPMAHSMADSGAGAHHASHTGGHAHGEPFDGLLAARAATAPFHSVSNAEAAGYARLPAPAPLHECIDMDVDTDDQDGQPAMGIHWVNGALLDGTVDVRKPEVLVYEPQRNGRLKLAAVEYVVFEADWGAKGTRPAPTLFGQELMYVPSPNRYGLPAFYALHAWVWKANPDGVLAPMNPFASCRYAAKVQS